MKRSFQDVAKLLAVTCFASALLLWSFLVWVIASNNASNNTKNLSEFKFLNLQGGLEQALITFVVFLLTLAGVYFLTASKRKHTLIKARQQSEAIEKDADYDKLTGILNQRGFEKEAISIIKNINIEETSHALLFMDLDRIKIVNDTVGRPAGDELLSQISYFIKKRLNENDIIGRLCGDEFAILLCNCNQHQAIKKAQQIIDHVDSFRLNWEDKLITVGATIGFVMIENDKISFPNLLGRASSACYSAKRNNRGNVVKYSQEHASSYQDMRVSMQIKHAIEQNQFILYHQCILDIRKTSPNINSSEVLIRMKEEADEKVIAPGIFLPIAERYNMMRAIDRWVINNLFQYIANNTKKLKQEHHRFYINLSGDSLNDDNFCDFLTDKIDEYGIDTKFLCFEITETIAIQNLQNAAYLIGFLKRLGCKFALDDFGTGTSSFAYLKYLPIDYLKIDGVFIKDIVNDPIDYEIVKAITRICNTMKIQVIAELVEDEKTINFLKQLDIDFIQGYAIQKPIPLE